MNEKTGALLYQILLGIGIAVVFFTVGHFTPPFKDEAVEPTESAVMSAVTTPSAASSSATATTVLTVKTDALSTQQTTMTELTTRKSTASSSATVSFPLNINTATKEELMSIKGIGEVFADRIIAYREEHGGFKSLEELTNIDGIGSARYEKFAPYLTLS